MAITTVLDLDALDVADRCATLAATGWAVRTVAPYTYRDVPRALVVLERDTPEVLPDAAGDEADEWAAILRVTGGRRVLEFYRHGARFLRVVGTFEAAPDADAIFGALIAAANRTTTTDEEQ